MKTVTSLARPVKGLILLAALLLAAGKSFSQAPANDNCAGAISLTSGSTTAGSVVNATLSTGVPAVCTGAATYDVWYSFVATTPYPTITLSKSTGTNSNNFLSPGIQLLSGTCGSLASLACSSTAAFSAIISATGLTIGNTYYVRVYSTSAAAPATKGSFNIIVNNPSTAGVEYGKSYVDVSNGNVGGTVQPGDTLEIRSTFVVAAGTAYNCSYTDNIPAGTTYIPGTLRILTNEGKIYQQFTDIADGDAGTIAGSAITINLGTGAGATTGGNITSTQKPSFYNSKCIMIASFRVRVNPTDVFNSRVSVGGGTMQYNPYNTGITLFPIVFPADTITLFQNYGICSNTVGTNAIISEFGGTFGSGSVKDRYASSKVSANYTYATFSSTAGMPNDEYYGVSNNTSGGTTAALGYSIVNTWAKPDNSQTPSHRIFSVWDIIGDHTGAANPLLGNPATDDNSSQSGGYMAVINADFATSIAFMDTIYNLCPNTYYQYTAWIRNICSKCGCDSNGVGATGSGYIPTAPGDSSGVYPNLTFNVNGYDYYTTGNILYTGKWAQKGFTYLTGPTQTSMIIKIRNNAPGGGGNDWAIDDIGVATCSPNMTLTPNKPDTVCQGTTDSVKFLVTSFFNNYTQWELQKSTDGGTTWVTAGPDTSGNAASGNATPVYNTSAGQYQYYVTRYFKLNLVDTLIIYRITIASTIANLSNTNCSFITMSPKIIHAINCNVVLPTYLISFKGQLKNGLGYLQWTTADETNDVVYNVERSDDGTNFNPIGSVKGFAGAGQGAGYHFTDPVPVTSQTYYRINILSAGMNKYSNLVLLSNTDINFDIRSLVNPFTDHITMDLLVPFDGIAQLSVVDMYGRFLRQERQAVTQGLNSLSLQGLGGLSIGTYILQIRYNDKMISRKIIKLTK
jgi:hypothetical protein